jgi:hypothetical protein
MFHKTNCQKIEAELDAIFAPAIARADQSIEVSRRIKFLCSLTIVMILLSVGSGTYALARFAF